MSKGKNIKIAMAYDWASDSGLMAYRLMPGVQVNGMGR
jgi:hypothetical protein